MKDLPYRFLSRAASRMVMSGLSLLLAAVVSRADETGAATTAMVTKATDDWLGNWFERVAQTQAEQPHWITPLQTVTPRLEQELRYDVYHETLPGGKTLNISGGGKGLELIPSARVELIIGLPSWESENTSPNKDGWSDESFLLKYRLLSANAQRGDYILTAFLGLSVPTGSANYTLGHYVVTPTLAGGKGWGNFDVQSTLGISLPDNGSASAGAGTPFISNTALQYRVAKYFWPELEVNYTHWPNGRHNGLDQVFLTSGLVVGRIPLKGRLGLTVGLGYQFAVTEHPLYRNNLALSVRLPF